MSQLKSAAALSYLNILLTNIIGLLLTPFIIRNLGKSEYGLYVLIGSFVTYLTLMDMGLNKTTIRFVARYRALNDLQGERRFLGMVMGVYFIMSLILVIIGMTINFNLETLFARSLSPEQIIDAKTMFLILIFNLAITLPGGSFTGICDAYECFVFPRLIASVKYVLRAVTIVVILSWGGKAVTMVVVDTVFNVVVVAVTAFYVLRKLKVRFSFCERGGKTIKQVLSYSIWIFILAVSSKFLWNAGQVILGIETNTDTVAVFAIGIMLAGYYGSFSTAFTSLFLPRATQMSIHNSREEIMEIMIKIGRISLMLLMFVFTGFFALGQGFIQLWIGDGYSQSWTIAIVVMALYTIPLIQNFANSLLEAENKVAFKAKIYLACFSFGLVLGYFLVPKYQEIGMLIGVGFGWSVAQIIMNIYFHQHLQLDIPQFFRRVLSGLMVPVSVLGVGLTFTSLFLPQTWFSVTLAIMTYTLIYWGVLFTFSMNHFERQLIRNYTW